MASKNEGMNSTIGEGSVFEGKFYISGSLKIDGKFEGEIKTDGELVVGETGRVKTDIFARSVVIAGTVIGNITAQNEIRLLETGKVLGDIIAPSISIQRGVVTHGQMTITGGHKKDAKKLIEDSFSSGSGSSAVSSAER
jgi:cytoskeletal protein CcmA (bactofilin family)